MRGGGGQSIDFGEETIKGADVTKGKGGCDLLEKPHPALQIFPCNEPTYYRGGAGITGGGP